jgi:lipopolysaccharide/colanic/teichoic acid biosynthesis glycosyltransferase
VTAGASDRTRSLTGTRPADGTTRRAVDLTVGLCALVVLLPALVCLALAIRISSPGPAFFRQERVGRRGTRFRIWKFRTMVVDAERCGPMVSGRADPRVTGIGRLLRATRMDELPQLINLIRGEMTLVGPRPEVPRLVAHYNRAEYVLLTVRPGIIGPGALLFAAEQADELDHAVDPDQHYVRYHLHPKLALDLEYLAARGLRRDVELILAALRMALGR